MSDPKHLESEMNRLMENYSTGYTEPQGARINSLTSGLTNSAVTDLVNHFIDNSRHLPLPGDFYEVIKARRFSIQKKEEESCGECSHGWIVGIKIKPEPDLDPYEEEKLIASKHEFSFRCPCPLGRSLWEGIRTWTVPQKRFFTRVDDNEKLL